MDPTPTPEVQKEDKKPNSSKGGDRKPKQKQQQQVEYVVKGEGQTEQQPREKQEKRERREKKERKEKVEGEGEQGEKGEKGEKGENQQKKPKRERVRPEFDWDKTKITLESKVPELPPHPLQKPDKELYFKQLDKIEDDIQKQWKHFKDFVEDVKKQQQLAKQGNQEKYQNEVKPLGQVIFEKQDLLKKKSAELKSMKRENDELKDKINTLFNQAQEYRNKMKILDNPDHIMDELARLKNSLMQDRLSASEEKRIVTQISALERSLPYVEPLQKIEKEQKALKTKSFAITKVMSALYDEIQALNNEVNQYRDDYEKLKSSTKDNTVERANPLIDDKRKDVENKVVELKEKKKKIKADYNTAWDRYEDYQDLVRYRDWFLKQLDRVKRDTEKKKREEERKKREEARAKREAEEQALEKAEAEAKAKELENVNPFQYQVELCETLINYCKKLKPATGQQQQSQQQKQVDIEQVLKSDEWKKEKCTVLKKDSTEDDIYNFSSLKALKDKKKNKNQQQKVDQPTEAAGEAKPAKPTILQHDLQVLQFFDAVKVATPFYPNEVDKVIQSIEERREYYLNKENWAKKEEESPQKKGEGKKSKQQKLDQEEFPALQ